MNNLSLSYLSYNIITYYKQYFYITNETAYKNHMVTVFNTAINIVELWYF